MCDDILALRALYTIDQVAELLGVSRHTVARWVKRGVLPTVTVDDNARQRFIPLSALRARAVVWDSVLLRMKTMHSLQHNGARGQTTRGRDPLS